MWKQADADAAAGIAVAAEQPAEQPAGGSEAGTVFSDEAAALERRLLGEVSTGLSTDLSESDGTERDRT